MSSTALPKVAFRSPPSASPRCFEISSVAKDSTAARGMMAKKFRAKTVAEIPFQLSGGNAQRDKDKKNVDRALQHNVSLTSGLDGCFLFPGGRVR